MDDSEALNFLLDQLSSSSLEEVTWAMMERLAADARHLAVLFCKYTGYVAIALTHTCFLLRHYAPPKSQAPAPAQQQQQQNGVAPAAQSAEVPTASASSFLPLDRVKGAAHESRY